MGYADGWPLDAVSVEAFGAGSLKQPFIADYASSHVLFYKLQQLSDSLDEADQQSLYTPQLLEKKERNVQGLCLLLRVLDAENLFHNSQHAHCGFQPAHKSMELNPYIKVYMVTSTSTQMQEQAVCSRVFRNDSNPHFDQYFWLWLADASDTSDAWQKKLVHIEIWHRSDIGADLFLGGKILQLDGNSPATRGLSLRKGCCNVTTVELNTLAEQHAEMRRIKERFFGRSPTNHNSLKTDDFFSSDEQDEMDDGSMLGIGGGAGRVRTHNDLMGSVQVVPVCLSRHCCRLAIAAVRACVAAGVCFFASMLWRFSVCACLRARHLFHAFINFLTDDLFVVLDAEPTPP